MTGFQAKVDRRAFIVGTAAALSGFTRSSHAQAATVRVSATPSIFRNMFEELRRQFQAKHPGIAVELTVSARNQDDQIQGTLRDALIGELPDVSFEGLNYLRLLQRRRIAMPLNQLIENDPQWNVSTYAPSVSDRGSVDRSIVGLGSAVSVPLIYYDVDRVAAVWASLPMPQDWDSMLALIDALGRRAKLSSLGAFCQRDPGHWIFSALVEGLGGSMMAADERRILFDQPPGRRALEIYRAFGQAGQARADMDTDQARQAFVGGGVALLVDSSSSLTSFENQIGGRFRLGTARFPLVSNGYLPAAGIASILQTRDPARIPAAWQFMKFVSGIEGQTLIGKSTGYFPANDLVVQRPDYLGSYYEARPLLRPIVASMPFVRRWYAFPGKNSPQIDAEIFDALVDVVTLSKTPVQAMDDMKRAVEALLA
jgi:multiple sugar transport system substrate-binding protein